MICRLLSLVRLTDTQASDAPCRRSAPGYACVDDAPGGVSRIRYPERMAQSVATPESLALREALDARRDEFLSLLEKYSATNPRLFGSMARGTAHEGSDIDILVEMDPADGNILMRASGLMEETRILFGRDDIDIFPLQLLRQQISESAIAEAVPL